MSIVLPRTDKDGNYYVSYSQLSSFTSDSGFNTRLPGHLEYFQSYFLKQRWPDQGWALFGSQVEDYICYRNAPEDVIAKMDKELSEQGNSTISEALASFTDEEKKVLDTIEPLGTFQKEIRIWLFENVYLLGYIDDCTEDLSWLRDYKTCSLASSKQYYTDTYKQLDIYSLYAKQETGKIPEKLEVVMIERKGNCFGMTEARDVLSVGKKVWYHERTTTEEKLFQLEGWMKKRVLEISDYYKLFLDLNVQV